MKITHVGMNEDNTVDVVWHLTMDEYKQLLKDAEAELELEGQKWLTTGEKGFQTRDRDRCAVEDDLYVKGEELDE